jgi:hypothetical protein
MAVEKKIFVNLTAHRLLPEQEEVARKELGVDTIVDADEVLPPEVVQKLRQCPSDPTELAELAHKVAELLTEFARESSAKLYVHLPVGSPAFMFILAQIFPNAYATPVFSHSGRIVQEVQNPDGTVTKKSIFKFEKFIVL